MDNLYKSSDNLMDSLFDNYKNNRKKIYDGVNVKKNLGIDNKTVMNIYFEKLQIRTMTINLSLHIDIDFEEIIKKFIHMFHNKETSIFDILYLKYLDKNNNLCILGEVKKKTSQFYNSFTSKILINNNILTVKFFKNSSLHITGCKDINNVKILIEKLIEYLKLNKNLILEDNKIDISILEKKKLVELKKIATTLKIEDIKVRKSQLIEKIMDTNYLIDICSKKNYIRSNIHKYDINKVHINICMINNSYTILNKVGNELKNFEIDRRKLCNYIKENTKLSCYYDNNSHQGVKIYFMYNEKKNGVCSCKENCILNSKNKHCKKITILIFNSAKIIITGSTNDDHAVTAYNYINNIIKNNYKEFVQLQI